MMYPTKAKDDYAVRLNGVTVPRDIVMKILSHLSTYTLLQCKLVSKKFDAIASDPSLYKKLSSSVFQPGGYLYRKSCRDAITFARSFPCLEKWTLCRSNFISKPERLAQVLPKLKSIKCKFVSHQGTGSFSSTLFELWPSLQKLQLYTWDLPPDVYRNLAEIVLTSHSLRENTIPTITSSSLIRIVGGTTPSVQALLRGCPKLRILGLWSHSLNEDLTSDVLQKLRVYDVTHPSALNYAGLYELQVTKWSEHTCSPTVRSLILENGTVEPEVLAICFPKVSSLTVEFLTDRFYSSTLETLTLKGSRMCRLPRLCSLNALAGLIWGVHNGHFGRPIAPNILVDAISFKEMSSCCPTLRYMCLRDLPLGGTCLQQTSSWWRKYGTINKKQEGFKVLVDRRLRGFMPQEFNQLELESKVGYFTGKS